MKQVCLIFLVLTFSVPAISQTEVPFTLEDRDRLILLESQMQSLRNEMETRFEAVNDKFASMESKFENRFATLEKMLQIGLTLLIFMLGAMVALFGFILWDRRAAVRPLQQSVENLADKNSRVISALREQAIHDSALADILKNTGVL